MEMQLSSIWESVEEDKKMIQKILVCCATASQEVEILYNPMKTLEAFCFNLEDKTIKKKKRYV